MKLGSKSGVFSQDGQTWLCSTGLPRDVTVEVGEISFHLHKFPLLSRSSLLEKLIRVSGGDNEKINDQKEFVVGLHDIPGGSKTFLLIAKFCYGVKIEHTLSNIVSLRCAAEYLGMNEDYGEGNLILETENFLNKVFCNWEDTIKALQNCEEVLPQAEALHIVSRCIDFLAMKVCQDPHLLSWPANEGWWYEDVSLLRLPFYRRLILAVKSRGMPPERIGESLMFYATKYLPLTGRQSSFRKQNCATGGSTLSFPSEEDQRILLEEIVALLPNQKGVAPTKLLLKLLRISMILNASSPSRENLEKRVGAQLDKAALEDLLIPNVGYSMETLYDVDCVKRMLDYFMLVDQDNAGFTSNDLVDEGKFIEGSQSLSPLSMVANLVDSYLTEVAPDVNLKLSKFFSLATIIPDYIRPLDDGLYRAIDIYLEGHPWLTDSERERMCSRLINCQKLSLEASAHAAQNQRLPIRFISQILFFQQIRLRTSVFSWYFDSENIDNSRNQSGNFSFSRVDSSAQLLGLEDQVVGFDEMKQRVSELENECSSMKREIEKLSRTKGSWNTFFCKKFGNTLNFLPCSGKASRPSTRQSFGCKTLSRKG